MKSQYEIWDGNRTSRWWSIFFIHGDRIPFAKEDTSSSAALHFWFVLMPELTLPIKEAPVIFPRPLSTVLYVECSEPPIMQFIAAGMCPFGWFLELLLSERGDWVMKLRWRPEGMQMDWFGRVVERRPIAVSMARLSWLRVWDTTAGINSTWCVGIHKLRRKSGLVPENQSFF